MICVTALTLSSLTRPGLAHVAVGVKICLVTSSEIRHFVTTEIIVMRAVLWI
jgi:hypothetical protein